MVTTFQPTTASAAVEGLPQVFESGAATGVEAVIGVDLSGREPGQWTLVIRDGICKVMGGRPIEPTVSLSIDSDLWLAIARGERRAGESFARGEYHVTGDATFVETFETLFPVY